MYEVIMPKLGLTMESGKIEKWHKKEGDKVETGDVLFEVMTDKVSLEVESYNSGVIKKILKNEGDEVPVTEVVAYIGEKDEIIPENMVNTLIEKNLQEDMFKSESQTIDIEGTDLKSAIINEDEKIRISPIAKKMAKENDLDISIIKGTGPKGRIVKKDILAFITNKDKEDKNKNVEIMPTSTLRIKSSNHLSGIRKIISERMVDSKKKIPHISLRIKVDVTDLVGLREQVKEKYLKLHNIKITYTDFIIKSCAAILRDNIEINSSYMDDEYIIYDDINIGLAVADGEDLVVPTIYKCDHLSLIDIAVKRAELVDKARNKKLSIEDISNGTFTITNLGMYGIRSSVPIINPPQAAIIAIGEIYNETAFNDEKFSLRSFMEMTLSCDHRIINGNKAAIFLKCLKEKMENPLSIFI